MICLTPAQLRFAENQTPVSITQGDFYFSTIDAVAECEHVFISGNALSERWTAMDSFVIAELGFGAGRNFLVTAERWLTEKKTGTLYYFSIEHQPLTRADLAKVLQSFPIGDSLKQELLEYYPAAIRGFHTLTLAHGRVRLVLLFDEAIAALNQLDTKAHVWYLDGFAPACNADAWTKSVLTEIYNHTVENGTLATYSAASNVRKELQNAGFNVQRKAGFGGKREMLSAYKPERSHQQPAISHPFSWNPPANQDQQSRKAVIIGTGLAGCSLAFALSQRNWQVDIYESALSLASGASGNPAAILMPKMSLDHNVASRLTCSGYQYTVNWLRQLEQAGLEFEHLHCGGLQFGRDQQQTLRMLKIEQQEEFPEDWLKVVNSHEVRSISNCKIYKPAWFFPAASCIDLVSLCHALITAGGNRVRLHLNAPIKEIRTTNSDHSYDQTNATLHHCSNQPVIIASGHLSNHFPQTRHVPVLKKRGQLTCFSASHSQTKPLCILNGDGYLTPSMNGMHSVGASFVTADSSTEIRNSEHQDNLRKLEGLLADFPLPSIEDVHGSAAVRAVSPDRLPLVGPISNPQAFERQYAALAAGNRRTQTAPTHYQPNLYMLSGFSSRGLSWIPLCAEYLAAKLNHEPAPLERSIAKAIHPNRFLFKALKQKVN